MSPHSRSARASQPRAAARFSRLRVALLSAAVVGLALFPGKASILDRAEPVAEEKLEYADLNPDEQAFVRDYVVGNAVWTLLHEAGHMLIDKLEMPVLGREEDAADAFATVVMLEAEDPWMNEALRDVASYWLAMGLKRGEPSDLMLDADHSVPRQRAFSMLCMMTQGDYSTFVETAISLSYPEGNCAPCYSRASAAWGKLLAPNIREAGKQEVAVTYGEGLEPEDPLYPLVRGWLKSARVLESVFGMLGDGFAVDGTINASVRVCSNHGDPRDEDAQNAYWMWTENEVVLCYEDAISTMDYALDEVRARRDVLADRMAGVETASIDGS